MKFFTVSLATTRYLHFLLPLVLLGAAFGQHIEAFPFNGSNGEHPIGALTVDSAGNFYGATLAGGIVYGCLSSAGCGVIFEITPPAEPGGKWVGTTLHKFTGPPDGFAPNGNLVVDAAGNVYGTTSEGGTGCNEGGCGTVFELSPPAEPGGDWSETVLLNFGPSATGGAPMAGLIADGFGNLYGTASVGGTYGFGAVFELSPPTSLGGSWTETVLYNFGTASEDGTLPEAPLISDSYGNLYGTTLAGGGGSETGTVFELSPAAPPPLSSGTWSETKLHAFGNFAKDGQEPRAGLVLTPGGLLLGTTAEGGKYGDGVVFVLFPPSTLFGSWAYTVGYDFGATPGDGIAPYAGLTLQAGENPVLYGTTTAGGASGDGTVYQLTPPSSPGDPLNESVIYSFTESYGDGGYPAGNLILQGPALYGTSESGGYSFAGTAFRLSH